MASSSHPSDGANPIQDFVGWDDLKPVKSAWRIEKPEPVAEVIAPFFPDQASAFYEKLIAGLPVIMQAMDSSGRLYAVNQQWCQTLGYNPGDVMGRSFNEFLTVESRSHLITQIYPKFLQTNACRNQEIFMHRKDGALASILLSMTAYRGDKGRIERIICVLYDVTERRIAQLASTRSDLRLRSAFSSAPHGMALVSLTGQIEMANPALGEFLGRDQVEKSTLAFDEMLHRDDRGYFLNGMGQLLAHKISELTLDLRYKSGTGDIVIGSTSITMVRNDRGEAEQLVVQIVDISERKMAESHLYQAQKMEAIGQLTGGLAHDFNNLLTIISGNLNLLETCVAGDEKATKRLTEALDAAQRGACLTGQLLAFARQQTLEPREVPVNDLVVGIKDLIQRAVGENVTLRLVAMPGAPKVLIDPSQLESAILNMAINARDAMPMGGSLTIETETTSFDRSYCEVHPEITPGSYVMIGLRDNGQGMSREVMEKVFQPFFTTKASNKGSGLGLSMVYGFIKQSGGHITISSEVGIGTCIKLYLPLVKPSELHLVEPEKLHSLTIDHQDVSQRVLMPQEALDRAERLPKILVVEDQEAVRAVACGFLSDFGYDVVEAADGFQALARLQEDPEIDLMFSDVVMPGGMNGFDLAQAANSLRPELKIVHTSGYPKGAMVHQDEPRFRQGFIIMKPYRREELQKIIRDAFDQQ